jgi:hypothetical protein
VSHCGLANNIKKYFKAKEKWCKFKYFTMQKYNLKKNPLKEKRNHPRYHNSITNFKFQHKQAKILGFKNSHIKINLLPRGQNPLSYYIMNLNTISLPW